MQEPSISPQDLLKVAQELINAILIAPKILGNFVRHSTTTSLNAFVYCPNEIFGLCRARFNRAFEWFRMTKHSFQEGHI